MSAFYSFQYGDRIQLLTDGAWLRPDGSLLCVDRKVTIFPDHPIVMTGRGVSVKEVYDVVVKILQVVESEGADKTVDEVIGLLHLFFHVLSQHGEFDAEFMIAAWSETIGPVHYFVPCHASHVGQTPFELTSPAAQISAGPPISLEDLKHLELTAADVAALDFPERHGAEIIGAMRGKRDQILGKGPAIFTVGGRCDLTTVTAAGVETRTLCEWDEVVGVPLDPSRGRTQ